MTNNTRSFTAVLNSLEVKAPAKPRLTMQERLEKAASWAGRTVKLTGTILPVAGENLLQSRVEVKRGSNAGSQVILTTFFLKDVAAVASTNEYASQDLFKAWAPKIQALAGIQEDGFMKRGFRCNIWESADETDPTQFAKSCPKWNPELASTTERVYVRGFVTMTRALVPMGLYDSFQRASSYTNQLFEAKKATAPSDTETIALLDAQFRSARQDRENLKRELLDSRTWQVCNDPDTKVPYGLTVYDFSIDIKVRSAGIVQERIERETRERKPFPSISDLFEMEDESVDAAEAFASDEAQVPEAFGFQVPSALADPFRNK